MITIEYSPEGTAIADHEAEAFVKNLIEDERTTKEAVNTYIGDDDDEVLVNTETAVSTENVITAARVLKKEQGIDIQFKYKDEILIPNKDGRLALCPDGFCDVAFDLLVRLF